MSRDVRLAIALLLAAAVVQLMVPVAVRVARRLDFLDHPRGYKAHGRATPYLGGSAVLCGFVLAVLVLAGDADRTWPLLAGVAVLWAIGTLDDRRAVAWWLRVLVEAVVATGLWAVGSGWDLGLGWAPDLALTVVWVLAVVNALNLFDNMDGQSATMVAATGAGIVALGVAEGDTWLAVSAGAAVGACLGFLPHNLLTRPARIFLGDGGSMPLGFAIAVLAAAGAGGATHSWRAAALGLLLVGIPALDTMLVLVSRRRRGVSFLTGGRDHLTHRALQRVGTPRTVALTLGTAQVGLSALAVTVRGSSGATVAAAALYVVGAAVAIAVIDARIPAVPPAATSSPAGSAADA